MNFSKLYKLYQLVRSINDLRFMQLNLPYVDVLHKSRYVGRTFIQPCVTSRKRSVAHKFAAITENVRGRRVVLVDDSVVRGTTIQPIVRLIREAGAREVGTIVRRALGR